MEKQRSRLRDISIPEKLKDPRVKKVLKLIGELSTKKSQPESTAELRYYAVVAKCGHVGRDCYAKKTFAVRAENGRRAAEIVRMIPRVKHHRKDAIISVEKISPARYDEINTANNKDPFFLCKSVQQQRQYEDPDIFAEPQIEDDKQCESLKKLRYSGKNRIRDPRKFLRMSDTDYEE